MTDVSKAKIIDTQDVEKARREIDSAHAKNLAVLVMARDLEFNAAILRNKKVAALLGPELTPEEGGLKYKASGITYGLAKKAAEHNIIIAANLDKLIEASGKEKAKLLARVMQNIKLCRKAKARFAFYTRLDIDKHTLRSLCLTLGMSTQQAKEAIADTVLLKSILSHIL